MSLPPERVASELFLSACESNDLNIVRHLLPLGADVNSRKENDGLSGLHFAARDNYEDLLELLLSQAGVDVNIATKKNAKPLMLACFCGHDNIARRLCRVNDIDLNCRTLQNLTALHGAVVRNHLGCVKVLRAAGGVDWNVREDSGWYPLTWSVNRGLADILQIILSVPEPNLDVSVTDPAGRNIAHIGVESMARDRQRCVELLCLDNRVDWNIRNRFGDTPLIYCLKNNRTSMALTLLTNPAVDLDIEDSDGRHVEEISRLRNMREILPVLWSFSSVRERIIAREASQVRQAPSLQSLSRDAVLLGLIKTNPLERLVTPLVERLGANITGQAKALLLGTYLH